MINILLLFIIGFAIGMIISAIGSLFTESFVLRLFFLLMILSIGYLIIN